MDVAQRERLRDRRRENQIRATMNTNEARYWAEGLDRELYAIHMRRQRAEQPKVGRIARALAWIAARFA